MSKYSESPIERLWHEYGLVFRDFDDLSLARWMSQTLSQLTGRVWRLSHPLLGTYRLAAQVGHERQIWLKRLASCPPDFPEAPCCRAPLFPLFTRDIEESGLICQHCAETAVAFEDFPQEIQNLVLDWTSKYASVHAVAHWDDHQRKTAGNYDHAYEHAAAEAQRLLLQASQEILPHFLEIFPVIVWEDQDECLEVRPEDIIS